MPVMVKGRSVAEKNGMLLPFARERNWGHLLAGQGGDTVRWEEKGDKLVWRGGQNGAGQRRDYVHILNDICGSDCDVKFAGPNANSWVTKPEHDGPHLRPNELVQYKWLLCIEGNEVATSLKWLMASSSVVVMPTPEKEGWLMEGLLVPYVHFVPFNDPHEVASLVEWLVSHESEVKQIVKNANNWVNSIIEHFYDPVPQLMELNSAYLATFKVEEFCIPARCLVSIIGVCATYAKMSDTTDFDDTAYGGPLATNDANCAQRATAWQTECGNLASVTFRFVEAPQSKCMINIHGHCKMFPKLNDAGEFDDHAVGGGPPAIDEGFCHQRKDSWQRDCGPSAQVSARFIKALFNVKCLISTHGSCDRYPHLSDTADFDDHEHGGPTVNSAEACEQRRVSWQGDCGPLAKVSCRIVFEEFELPERTIVGLRSR
jgi:hypothetical protein